MRVRRPGKDEIFCKKNFKGDKKVWTIKLQLLRRDFETMKTRENVSVKKILPIGK